MARAAGADLLVRRVRREARRVADGGRVDPRRAPEHPLGAPEAAHPEDRALRSVGEGRADRRPEDEVTARDVDRRVAAGERVLGGGHRRRLAGEEHGRRVAAGRGRPPHESLSHGYGFAAASQPSYSPSCCAATFSNHARNAATVSGPTVRCAVGLTDHSVDGLGRGLDGRRPRRLVDRRRGGARVVLAGERRKWMTCLGFERSAPRPASCRSASASASCGVFGAPW